MRGLFSKKPSSAVGAAAPPPPPMSASRASSVPSKPSEVEAQSRAASGQTMEEKARKAHFALIEKALGEGRDMFKNEETMGWTAKRLGDMVLQSGLVPDVVAQQMSSLSNSYEKWSDGVISKCEGELAFQVSEKFIHLTQECTFLQQYKALFIQLPGLVRTVIIGSDSPQVCLACYWEFVYGNLAARRPLCRLDLILSISYLPQDTYVFPRGNLVCHLGNQCNEDKRTNPGAAPLHKHRVRNVKQSLPVCTTCLKNLWVHLVKSQDVKRFEQIAGVKSLQTSALFDVN